MSLRIILYPLFLLFFLFEPKLTRHYMAKDGLPHNTIRTIYVSGDDKVWVGTPNGAGYFEEGLWTQSPPSIQRIKKGVPSIFEDSESRVWLGSIGFLYLYEDNSLNKFSIQNDLKLEGRLVFSIFEDDKNRIWAATTGGAALYKSGTWVSFTEESGLLNNVVHDIAQDAAGRYWFATRKGGLNIFDERKWLYLFPDKNCRKILRDSSGNMWVGTNDGIVKYDGSEWTVSEEGKTVLPMFEGTKSTIWATTDSKEVIRISKEGKVIRYDDLTGGRANIIYHIAQNNKGTIWAGTDNGVMVFE